MCTGIAARLNLIAPIAEQCEHHMLHRDRPEGEYEYVHRCSSILDNI